MKSTLNPEALRFIAYVSFKLDCAREQEELGWRLDYDRALRNYTGKLGSSASKRMA